MQELILLPEEESIGERADKYLAVQLPQYSRSFFQKLFKDDQIQIQNTPIKASYRITGEEEIALTIPDAQKPDIVPENIPLDILYESGSPCGKQAERHGGTSGSWSLQRNTGQCTDVSL